MFGGYARYRFYAMNERWLRVYRLLPRAARTAIRNQVATSSLLSSTLRRKLQHTFVGRGEDLESLYLDNFYSAFLRCRTASACFRTCRPLLPTQTSVSTGIPSPDSRPFPVSFSPTKRPT